MPPLGDTVKLEQLREEIHASVKQYPTCFYAD